MRTRNRIVMALSSVVMVGSLASGVQPAAASHFQCSGYVPVWVSGAPGVEVAVDASVSGWSGLCVYTLDGGGNRTSFFSAKVGMFDQDPGRPGVQVRFGTCGDPSGDCSAFLLSTGAEIGAGLDCPHGALELCKSGSTAYANGAPVDFRDDPGISFDEDLVITDGAVVCPFLVCYQEQRIQIGTLHVFIPDGSSSGYIHEDVDLCAQLGNLGPSCLTVPGT